jgi:hypothetical protein
VLFLLPVPFLTGLLIDTLIWKRFLLGRIQVPFRSLFAAEAGAEAVVLSLPGGFALADPLKVLFLKKRLRILPSQVIAGLVARHWLLGITQVLYIFVVCGIGLAMLESHTLAAYFQSSSMILGFAASIVFCLVLIISVKKLFHGELARIFWRLLYRFPIPFLRRWLKQFYFIFIETDRQFCSLGTETMFSLAMMVGLYFVFWTVEAFETLVVAHVLGFSLGMLEALMIEALLSALKLGMFFLPAGAGVKDVGYVALFAVLGVNVGGATLAGFVIVKRIASMGFIALGYGILAAQGISPFLKHPLTWKAITET